MIKVDAVTKIYFIFKSKIHVYLNVLINILYLNKKDVKNVTSLAKFVLINKITIVLNVLLDIKNFIMMITTNV